MKHKQEVPVEVVPPMAVPPMAVTEVIEVDSDDEGACHNSDAVADCLELHKNVLPYSCKNVVHSYLLTAAERR